MEWQFQKFSIIFVQVIVMEELADGSVIYTPYEHDEAQRALACVHELQAQNGKSPTTGDKVTRFNTNTSKAVASGGE